MDVTFLIGNGCDLRLGMHTRYKDMYKGYVVTESKAPYIEKFKAIIKADEQRDYMTWGDFEMAMAEYAKEFDNENEFIQCVRDFKQYMAEHLRREQEDFLESVKAFEFYNMICAKEMSDSLLGYYNGQTPNVINEIKSLEEDGYINYNFISFNYTSTFDYLLSVYRRYYDGKRCNSPIHIHGSLDKDIVLGVDNVNQFPKMKFGISKKMERAFVKPRFNAEFDVSRVAKAENIVDKSDVICIYGMSLGSSDDTWVLKLRDWLLVDSKHHLFYYSYSTDAYNDWNSDEKMDVEDERKEDLLKKFFNSSQEQEAVIEQVHIPVGYDIFDFVNKLKASITAS